MRISPKDSLYEISPEILKTLRVIFWENVYSTKGIQIMLKAHPDWGENKRALFSETIYNLIRWWRLMWYILDRDPSPEEKDLQKLITVYLISKKGDLSLLQKKRGLDANQVTQRTKEFFVNQSLIGLINKVNKNLVYDGMLLLHH
jgi:16S rRNA (cytosine967-C5)-methyltransferase